MLRHGHNIDTGRQTEDVDFAVMVPDWEAFTKLRAALIRGADFVERPGPATHRLRHKSGMPLDIVPFGGIERADRTIAWPPDQSTVFDCFGAHEAFAASVSVMLPANVRVQIASIPALALLKVTAWQDRKLTQPGKDAGDLLLYLRHYMDCDNFDRAGRDHGDLYNVEDYDHEGAGARLIGRDIALLLDEPAIRRVSDILLPQANARGPLLLAGQSGLDLERARRLIDAAFAGLVDTR
jgi:predicted nucleotidyltransferase